MSVNTRLKKRAAELGVTLHELFDNQVLDLAADAPVGKVFNASGCHAIVVNEFAVPEKGQRDLIRQSMLDQLNAGLDDCDDPECEICHEVSEP